MQQEIYKNPDLNVFNAASGICVEQNSEKKNKTFYLWAMEKKGLWLWVKG